MKKEVLKMTKRLLAIFFISLACLPQNLWAAQKMPATNVVVSKVTTGIVAPEVEFIGTVYYPEVSDVSAEVSGTVKTIQFEEGQHIRKGTVLITVDSAILTKTLQAKVASHEQILSDLERARKDLERIANLYRKNIIAEKEYDDQKFQVKGLERRSASLKAEVERLEIELNKTEVKSPFGGVVIKKHVARGEWLSPGSPVATVARDNVVDVIVEVPADIIKHLKVGMDVTVLSVGHNLRGKLHAIIPRGDISTRTFPVKIRVKHGTSLLEGMEARVKLPQAEKITAFLVPRDAILNTSGKTVIVAIVEGKAKVIPTKVTGYTATSAAINSKDITEGMTVVVKGNERLRDGQPVTILKEIK